MLYSDMCVRAPSLPASPTFSINHSRSATLVHCTVGEYNSATNTALTFSHLYTSMYIVYIYLCVVYALS